MIDKYQRAKGYLDSLLNYERRPFFSYKRSFKLERTHLLLKHLQISYQGLKAIHIAGTKGKGSTAHFCAYLLAASGFKVGLFTSPHLFDFRERIQIVRSLGQRHAGTVKVKNSLISKKDMVKIIEEFRMGLKNLKISQKLGQVTFFEVFTAAAFKYFLQKDVDFVILESGLGGRLDSTNVVNPLVDIITYIDYDHTDKLGKKLAEIATEKAGIIKKNTPLICSFQRPSCLKVIKDKCKSMGARLFLPERDFKAQNIRFKQEHTLFNFEFNGFTPLEASDLKGKRTKLLTEVYPVRSTKFKVEKQKLLTGFTLKNLKIHLKGKHQVENASLALAALFLLGRRGVVKKRIDYKGGLKASIIPGRFEVVSKSPLIIVDIAHNASSFSALGDSLKKYFPRKKIILIFACSQDKDAKKMLKEIDYFYLILTRFDNPRSQDVLKLKSIVKDENAYLAKDIGEALEEAKEKYKDKRVIVISGSLFLVSEAKKLLQSPSER